MYVASSFDSLEEPKGVNMHINQNQNVKNKYLVIIPQFIQNIDKDTHR